MSLTPQRHIWACANSLIQQHGENAWFQVSVRADELLAAGDFDGHQMFMAILARAAELQRMESAGSIQ